LKGLDQKEITHKVSRFKGADQERGQSLITSNTKGKKTNHNWRDGSGAKGGMDMDGSGE
jgi:hypothetical protein